MNKRPYLIILVLFLGLSACKSDTKIIAETDQTALEVSSNLEVDHLNIWVKDPTKAKEKLTSIGFTAVPDSLSQIHHGQGTSGRYFNFLNSYLELIFVYDQNELVANNSKNKDLDFTTRANFDTNGASPFSIALKIKDYDINKIPFEKVRYHQDWMEDNTSIYTAKNSKKHMTEPSIFVVYPAIQALNFSSQSDLDHMPSDDDSWKDLFRHPNGAQKITQISITSTDLDLESETIKTINGIKNITVDNGNVHLMELVFDNNTQGKSFDLRPELPLIIHL